MAQTRINGNFGILYKWVTDAYVVVGCATTNSFSSTATVNEQDVNKCDPETINKNYGGVSQSIDFEGHIVTDADKESFFELLADQESQVKNDYKFDFDTNNAGTNVKYFSGIIADISSTQEVNQDSTWSMTLEVDGLSTNIDPNV